METRNKKINVIKLDESLFSGEKKNIDSPSSNFSIYPDYITPPIDTILELSNVVISSNLDLNSKNLTEEILQEFNKFVPTNKSCFIEDIVRGERILPGKFLLGSRNNRAELHGPSSIPIARRLLPNPASVTKIIKAYHQADLFYGTNGSYVLNVPKGYFAKALSGQKPIIYNEGTHVIHDSTLQFKPDDLISQSQNHIQHQTINILRVPAGHIAKILLDGMPYILPGRREHYVFDSANFQFIELVQEFERYIQHENIHILRVPSGMLAKIFIGSEAQLLEPKTKPYIFNTPLFRLVKPSKNELFFNATEQITKHGAIKRIIPHTGQVVVTYDSGQLKIYHPSSDGKPIFITSPTHEVVQILNVGVETLVFPSEETKTRRKEENPDATSDEIAYAIFTTSDSLKVGVKLLVAFEIIDPQVALTNLLNYQGILTHIENCAIVDMGKAIQRCTATEFTSTYHNQPKTIEIKEHEAILDPFFHSNPILHFQDEVKKELGKDLKEFGIKLIRLNVETPKIIDTNIQKAMEEQSIISAQVNTEAANLEKKYFNAKRQAEQKAEQNRINVQQQNDAMKAKAEARLAAAKNRAEAKIMAAKAKADSLLIQAQAEQQAKELLGGVYEKNPKLVELEMKRLEAEAIAKFHGTLVTPNMNSWPSGILATSPFSLFHNTQLPASLASAPVINHEDKIVIKNNN